MIKAYFTQSAKLFIVTTILPAAILLHLSRNVFIERGFLFDVDLLIVVFAACGIGPSAAAFSSIVVVLAGVLVVAADVYFFDPWIFIRSALFLSELSIDCLEGHAIVALVALGLVLVFAILCIYAAKDLKLQHAALPFFAFALVIAIDSMNGLSSFYNYNIGTTFLDQKLAGSFLSRLIKMQGKKEGSIQIDSKQNNVISASQQLVSDVKKQHVVLIIVESWGMPVSADANRQIVSNLMTLRDRYEITSGLVPFHGGTTFGELRELCNVSVDYATISSAHDCLPQRLANMGYQVTAYHGFSNKMFNRNVWWKKIGLVHSEFAQSLSLKGLIINCGAVFKGICDNDLSIVIRDKLIASQEMQFIYWLTLNTHLPIPVNMAAGAQFDCQLLAANEIDDSCRLSGLLKNFMDNISALASDPKLPPTEFLLVGDHAPPFANLKMRSRFVHAEVPYIHLVPH